MWGLSDGDLLDKNKIKIIDGIAGAAKSSGIDNFMRQHGIEYGRYTSTNKLSRDAFARYGCHCDTIAGGLFNTQNGIFYIDEKDPDFETVVIDEVLQASPKVFEWITSNVGKVNIIVTTDSQQMLNASGGMGMLKLFERMKTRPDVIAVELTKTYRPRTEKTAKYFTECYQSAKADDCLYYRDKKKFKTIPFASLRWEPDSVYICHTNEHEKYLYNEFDLFRRYECDLIPKGSIAKKEKGFEKYPILPQSLVGNVSSYCQLANVATPTRYQGSEVKQGQKLYYLVSPHSGIEAREWYTVVTRCWDIDSIILVLCDLPINEPLTEYGGAIVKPSAFATVENTIKLDAGGTLADLVGREKRIEIPEADFDRIIAGLSDEADRHFLGTGFYCDGCYVTKPYTGPARGEKGSGMTYAGVSIRSLMQKDGALACGYLPAFYRAFEKVQKERWSGAPVNIYHAAGPVMCCHGRETDVPFEDTGALHYSNVISRDKYRYELDLYSAYPHILAKAKLPTGIRFRPRPDGLADNPYCTSVQTDGIDWYLCGSSDYVSEGSIITGDLARMIQRDGKGGQLCYYIGTSDSQIGSNAGNWLLEKAFGTIESKAEIKEMHYGWLEKAYLEPIEYRNGDVSVYAANDYYNHELVMCAIRSELCRLMLKVKEVIYGRYDRGYTVVDALFFDSPAPVAKIGEAVEAAIPGYAFRIKENGGEILWKNYPDLETKKERKNRLRRECRARKSVQ